MKLTVKHIAFAALAAACIAAAILLFLPDRHGNDAAPAAPEPVSAPESVPRDAVEDLVAPPRPEAASGAWNTYHGSHALQGVADTSFPDALEVLWRVEAGAPLRQPPVALDGRVFAATAHGGILAADLEGRLLWRVDLADVAQDRTPSARMRIEAPPVAFNHKVFVGTDGGILTALDADTGAVLWRADIDGPIRGAPNYLPDRGHVVVIEQDRGVLSCFDAESGEIQWRTQAVDRSDGSPATSGDFAVYGSCASALHVVATETGAHLRDIKIENGGGQVAGGVAVAGGFAYAGVRDGRVMRADIEAGTFLWTTEISEDEVFSTPAVRDDWVVVSSYDGFVHGLDRSSGDVRWRRDLVGVPSSPVIAGDKVIIAADGILFLLRLEDGAQVWEMPLSDEISGPAVLPGMIIVGGEDGVLTALGPVRPGAGDS